MCPLCLSTLAWLAVGGGSSASAATLLAGLCWKGKNHGDHHDASDRDA
jgi:hypothetical protein